MNRGNMARFGANAEEDHLQIFIPYNRFYTNLDSGEVSLASIGIFRKASGPLFKFTRPE